MDRSTIGGVYLPLITPFLDDKVDDDSIRRMLSRYVNSGIAGIVLLGTTGESPVMSPEESEHIVRLVADQVGNSLPLILGISGNDTRAVAAAIESANSLPVNGFLLTAPYYNRPSQAGIAAHFHAAADSTGKSIIVYNIPYRTGVNITNHTLLDMVDKHDNIVGVKDSCGDFKQSTELLRDGKDRLAVLTGEDHLFFATVALGGAGGILAASHVLTESFVDVHRKLLSGDREGALEIWNSLSPWIPGLFGEPNPAPLKVWMAHHGLIASPECRLPLAPVGDDYADDLLAAMPSDPHIKASS